MRSKKLTVIAVLVCISAGLGWMGLRKLGTLGEGQDAIARAEQALSTPGMIALARIDVPALTELLAKAQDGQTAAPLDFDAELLEPLGLRGVSLAAHVSTALLAVSSADELRVSAVLFGAFDTAAIERAIQSADPQARAEDESGGRTLYLARLDPDSCAETSWAISLRPERIVIRNERALAPLLAALGEPDPPPPAWRAQLVQRPLATLAFTPTAPLAQADAHPLARALLRGGQRAFPGVESAALRIERKTLRSGLELEMELRARDAEAGAALASAWEKTRVEGAEWADLAPAFAAWLPALRIEREGAVVQVSAARDAEAARELRDLPATLVLVASRDLGEAAEAGRTDQVEPWPTAFLESFALAKLPAYGAIRDLSEPTDAVAGPFGVRIERAARSGADDPLEIALRAYGPLIPNLPPDAAARFSIENVLDKDGKPLLREERCGRSRNTLPSRLRRESIFERTEAEKKLRLRPGTRLADVDRIDGHIELDLPQRTQTVRAREPHAGQVLEAPSGGSVEITSVTATSFSYRVHGEPRLVHIRGLNADRATLAAVEAWESELPFGDGRLGARRYAGALASLEAIFALDVKHGSYPFALASARPGTDGASLDVESSEFIHYSADQYRKEFGAFRGHAWPVDRTPLGSASAGPFTVGVTSLASGATLAPQLTVLAPAVPNLTYNATALELTLSEVGFLEGRPLQPAGARTLLQVRHRYGRTYLEGVASFDTGAPKGAPLHHVSGELSLKLPHEVESASFTELEPGASLARGDVSFTLSDLSRDGFTLRMTGPLDRFFCAQAFAEDGKELSVEALAIPLADTSGSRELRFRVQGQPRRIAIQLVRGYTTQRYAFRIPLGEMAAAPEQ